MGIPTKSNSTKIKAPDSPRLGLTIRQWKFCEEYLKCGNGAESYIRAGYNVKDRTVARSCASTMLTNPTVKSYIAAARRRMAKELQLDQATILHRLMMIGFGKIDEEVVTKAEVGESDNGRPIYEAVVVKKKPSARDQKDALVYLSDFMAKAEEQNPAVSVVAKPVVEFGVNVRKAASTNLAINMLGSPETVAEDLPNVGEHE